jgi:hypothetical protein
MWLDGVRRLGHMAPDGVAHRMVVMQQGRLGARLDAEKALLGRISSAIPIRCCHCTNTCSNASMWLICGMVQKSTNIMYKKRI